MPKDDLHLRATIVLWIILTALIGVVFALGGIPLQTKSMFLAVVVWIPLGGVYCWYIARFFARYSAVD